jgi:hypothetical protein
VGVERERRRWKWEGVRGGGVWVVIVCRGQEGLHCEGEMRLSLSAMVQGVERCYWIDLPCNP